MPILNNKNTFPVEITRSVEEMVKEGYDEFDSDYAWSERKIRMEIGLWMEMLGLPRRLAHGCKLRSDPEFIEWDSGNPSHAGGYWLISVEFKPKVAAQIERASQGED